MTQLGRVVAIFGASCTDWLTIGFQRPPEPLMPIHHCYAALSMMPTLSRFGVDGVAILQGGLMCQRITRAPKGDYGAEPDGEREFGCCQTNANSSQNPLPPPGSGSKEAAPLVQSSGTVGFEIYPALLHKSCQGFML